MFPVPTAPLNFRRATRADVPAVMRLITDDPLGAKRERVAAPWPDCYFKAFDAIESCSATELIVVESEGEIIGTLQLTVTPNMNFQGNSRATIESVHVAASARNRGVGGAMMRHAIELARQRGCAIVQLSTHKSRPDAKRFYERLGFNATHEGMKLYFLAKTGDP